jgi:short-subunit dehydrogenase
MQAEQALVTGAGSGIGREFVRLALEDGARVLAVSLIEAELEKLRSDFAQFGDRLTTRAQDLSKPDAAETLSAWCDGEGFQIDTLFNNAGFAVFGDVVDADLKRVENMIELSMLSLTKLSALFGARMKARGKGNILNVGSTAGMVAAQRFAIYGGSKAYVNFFTVTLRAELAPFGVNVTLLTPGATATKFAQAAQIDTFGGKSMLKDLFAKGQASSPAEVARAGYEGMRKGKAQVLVGKGARLALLASRLVPLATMPRLSSNL